MEQLFKLGMKKEEANQIKNELFTSIRELGLQDELKTHLRIQLCEKLKQKDLIKSNQSHEDKLYNRIMVSLISEELTSSDCRYSNSIYTAESGYDMKILSRNEVIEVMGMSEEDLNPNLSVISNLMKKKYPFSGNTIKSISIQTNPEEVGYSIEQRLALIDQEYRKNITFGTANKEETDYKKKVEEVEADLKRRYEKDLERFKEFESHSIKVRVSQEWRKKFQEYSHHISEDYKRKMDHLRKKETLLEDGIVSKNKVLDEKVNNSHKTFLNKIDILDIKSVTMDEVKKNLEIERNRVREEYNNREKELKAKIREYDSLLITTKEKIEYEVGIAKLSIQQEYQDKNAEFLTRKKYIDEEYGKLMGIKDTTDVIKEENKRLFDENMRLRKDLTEIEQELRITVSENGAKGDRLDSLRGELNELNRNNNTKDDTLKEQTKKIKKKDEEIIEIRKELDKLRKFKENQEEIEEAEERPRNPPETFKPNSLPAEMINKAEQLSKERQKYIEKLKLEL